MTAARRKHIVFSVPITTVRQQVLVAHDDAVSKAEDLAGRRVMVEPGSSFWERLDALRGQGAHILAFETFTGGLVAPKHDDNPWRYKFTWNPRNVVMAGEAGAQYMEVGNIKCVPWQQVFHHTWLLDVPGVGRFRATMINAGIPTIFLNAAEVGYTGTELQDDINNDEEALARFETIRAWGAVRMGLIDAAAQAASRQHTPKVAFVAAPASYTASSGKEINAADIDLLVRALSMGKLHHAMMGTAAVAIGTAAAIPGTLVNLAAGGGERDAVRFGHPSGTLKVGAQAREENGEWRVLKASMSRSARVLMEGWVRVPGDAF